MHKIVSVPLKCFINTILYCKNLLIRCIDGKTNIFVAHLYVLTWLYVVTKSSKNKMLHPLGLVCTGLITKNVKIS